MGRRTRQEVLDCVGAWMQQVERFAGSFAHLGALLAKSTSALDDAAKEATVENIPVAKFRAWLEKYESLLTDVRAYVLRLCWIV